MEKKKLCENDRCKRGFHMVYIYVDVATYGR